MLKLSSLLALSILLSVGLNACGKRDTNANLKKEEIAGAKVALPVECDKLNLEGKWDFKTTSWDGKTLISTGVFEFKLSKANTYTRVADSDPRETVIVNPQRCTIEYYPVNSDKLTLRAKITDLVIDAKNADKVTFTSKECLSEDCSRLGSSSVLTKIAADQK